METKRNPTDPVAVCVEWQQAAFEWDFNRVVSLSTPDILAIGPGIHRRGHDLLSDYLRRALLLPGVRIIHRLRAFARKEAVVLEALVTFIDPDSEIAHDEGLWTTCFLVREGFVSKIWYRETLEEALEEANLTFADEHTLRPLE